MRLTDGQGIAGIPTLYRGVQYRSRLEARWAAFFDLVGWPFQYEPFDLRGWIPDFVLTGGGEILVEVKPVLEFPPDVGAKVVRSGFLGDVLIVGCTIAGPWDPSYHEVTARVGWLREGGHPDEPPSDYWSPAVFGSWRTPEEPNRSRFGLSSQEGFWRNLVGPGVGKYYNDYQYVNFFARDCWDRAGNAVQWRGPRSEAT
jgi:hypothetical protein